MGTLAVSDFCLIQELNLFFIFGQQNANRCHHFTEEEKKLLAGLLGKLYISPGSSEDRLREAYTEVSDAVEDGLLTDATSRNSLYKIHVSLGKIVNTLDEQQPAARAARSSVVSSTTDDQPREAKTEAMSETSKIEEEEEDELENENDATVTAVLKKDPDDESVTVGALTDDDNDTVIRDETRV